MSEHHWRNEFKSNYFGSHLMPEGKDMILTISKVQPEDLTTTDGQKKHGLVCYWAEDQLPMVLNKTNAQQIAKLLKENDYTKWAGHRIQIYVDHAVRHSERPLTASGSGRNCRKTSRFHVRSADR